MELKDSKGIYKDFAIIHHTDMSSSRGGPPGYLYNLFSGFSGVKPKFLSLEMQNGKQNSNKHSESSSNSGMFANYLRKNQDLRIVLFYIRQGFRYRKRFSKGLNEYKIIHVHTSESAVYVRLFCKYRGILVLTPHRPESLDKEIIGGLPNSKNRHFFLKCFLKEIESLSYKYCDAFIFPSRGAAGVYKSFPGYTKYGKIKPHKYVYTGIQKRPVTIKREAFREKLGISNDTFVVGYIGRHSYIKGYDRLVNAYPELRNIGIEVVAAGEKSNIKPQSDKGWHELGYISDSQNLINAVDLVVVPNRDTYFDLIILEALAQGKRVITSNTGGNKDIAKDTTALILFNNDDEAELTEKIIEAKDQKSDIVEKIEKDALLFCDSKCNVKEFAYNYTKCIADIYRELK